MEDILTEPVARLLSWVQHLQVALLRLLGPSPDNPGQCSSALAAQPSASAPTPTERFYASKEAGNSSCAGQMSLPYQRKNDITERLSTSPASAPTVLMAAPTMTHASCQLVPMPALAIAAAAACLCVGFWLFKRWRTALKTQRELEQRNAVKRDSLVRQKQRFQRALNVDSVNVELPAIKELDVQPDPLRVEHVLAKRAAPLHARQGAPSPALGGDSLRKWQQFMAASRMTEVTNLSGNQRGGRGKTEDADARPFDVVDDRALADLSERIRRANEAGVSGAAAAAPVITFEQLYASNSETDDEAMARRAAERKARWQQKQAAAPVVSTSGQRSVTVPQAAVDEKRVTVPPPVVSKPRSKPLDPSSNPFLKGLNVSSPQPSASSSAAQSRTVRAVAGSHARVQVTPLRSSAAPANDVASSSGSSSAAVAGRLSARDRVPADSSAASPGRLQGQPSTSATRTLPDRVVAEKQQGLRNPDRAEASGGALPSVAAEPADRTPAAAPGRIVDGGDEQRQRTAAAPAAALGSRQQEEAVASSASVRPRRAAAVGPLRKPDASDPSLVRLMRRPTPQ